MHKDYQFKRAKLANAISERGWHLKRVLIWSLSLQLLIIQVLWGLFCVMFFRILRFLAVMIYGKKVRSATDSDYNLQTIIFPARPTGIA